MKSLYSNIIEWYWPVIAFISPWAFWPFELHNVAQSHITHYLFSYIIVIIWIIIYYVLNYHISLFNLKSLIRTLKRYPHLAAIAAFAAWTLIASAFAPQPIVSLTGNLITYRDAALHFPALAAIAIFIGLYSARNPRLLWRTAKAVVASGVIFAVMGILEIIIGKGFFYNTSGVNAAVLFAGPGHLAGFLALISGTAGGLSGIWRWIPLAILAMGIGVTTNRTSIGAAILSLLSNFRLTWGFRLASVVLFSVFIALGWSLYKGKTDRFRSDFTALNTLESRLVFWRIALSGIGARPLTGWGGGQFVLYISQVANSDDLKFMISKRGVVVKDILFKKGDFIVFETTDGKRGAHRVIDWSPHNLFLDISLSWGLVGLAIYIIILFYTILPAFGGNPASLGVLAYHLFLLLWPPSVEAAEVLWVLFGLAGFKAAASFQSDNRNPVAAASQDVGWETKGRRP